MRKVWTGSEGEESEGRTKDWKWSGAVVSRVWKRDGVQARAGRWYPGHQQLLGGSKSWEFGGRLSENYFLSERRRAAIADGCRGHLSEGCERKKRVKRTCWSKVVWRLVPAQCLCSKKSSCEKGVDWQ